MNDAEAEKLLGDHIDAVGKIMLEHIDALRFCLLPPDFPWLTGLYGADVVDEHGVTRDEPF